MSNKRKIIYSVLKEIENKGAEPRATDYGISTSDFGDIIVVIRVN